ncbi:MAG: hypothetical protein NTZ95_01895 [Candidatus Omnitrophica bacterium]|nr:hypothetical protein [Candidatus Omnitrophota bacterium]
MTYATSDSLDNSNKGYEYDETALITVDVKDGKPLAHPYGRVTKTIKVNGNSEVPQYTGETRTEAGKAELDKAGNLFATTAYYPSGNLKSVTYATSDSLDNSSSIYRRDQDRGRQGRAG